MKTLLAFNETIALLGDIDGSIHTESLPIVRDETELRRSFYNQYREPGVTTNDAEYIDAPRVGAMHQTESSLVNILETDVERIPMKTYTDDASNLSVRAAFDPKTQRWVVARLAARNPA